MAGELIWSRGALDDLEAIATFVARDSPLYASRLVARIVDQAERLLGQSQPGSRIPELPLDQVREQRLGGFRLLFERQGEDLHLLAVVHVDQSPHFALSRPGQP